MFLFVAKVGNGIGIHCDSRFGCRYQKWGFVMDDDFGELGSYREKRAPITILVVAAIVVTVAYALLAVAEFTSHVVGYALGSVVTAGLVAVFMRMDAARRNASNVVYIESRAARYVWSVVLLAGIVACSVHAWHIASELAAL